LLASDVFAVIAHKRGRFESIPEDARWRSFCLERFEFYGVVTALPEGELVKKTAGQPPVGAFTAEEWSGPKIRGSRIAKKVHPDK
jgi:hypothetical protein